MSVKPDHHELPGTTVPSRHEPNMAVPLRLQPAFGEQSLAVLRIATGLIFLWAFADKLFGLGYSTSSAGAWINGGSPTKSFLRSVDVGPFASMFHAWAGTWWADWLFMIAVLGIGLALVAGVALRITAGAGTVLMLLMWAAEWPLARSTGAGVATHSSNPILDYHLVYALVLIVLAATLAGDTWGLGKRWAALVEDRPWLR